MSYNKTQKQGRSKLLPLSFALYELGSNNMQWYAVENTETSKFPEWARSFGINDQRQVFVPAAMANVPEREVHLCTLSDNTPSIVYKDHYFVPADWLCQEFPKTKELCEIIKASAAELMTENLT